MYSLRSSILLVATLAAGCTAKIEDGPMAPGSGTGTGTGTGISTGTGTGMGTGTGVGTGTGAGTGTGTGTGTSVDPQNPAACTPGVPATSQIPRLTNVQYDRTVRDLLGVTALKASNNIAPSQLLATDQSGSISDIAWSVYQSVADQIATQVMADATLKTKFLSCTPTGDGAQCLHDSVVKFGRKAFRRPMTSDEIAAFDAVIAKGKDITPTGAPEEVARALVYMFLISPSFLMRAEITDQVDAGGHYKLSPYETASRLSYMLWGSAPDDALNQAADQGQLSTPDQILAQAQRMLQDPKARDMVIAFHNYYLLLGTNTRWDTLNKDSTLFPAFSKDLIPTLEAETQMFMDDVVFGQKAGFQALLTSPVAFVNNKTASFYGLNPANFGADLQKTTLDPTQRPGFLTRIGFLQAYSSFNRTSPILRGAFITKQVLGIDPGAPPPGAAQTPLPDDPSLDTVRKQVDALTADANCVGCHHTFINPPGFVMEAFDTVGSWETKDASTGAAIDTTADVFIDGQAVPITSPSELMSKIATSQQAREQYARKWIAFAYEREGDPNDACTVSQLGAKLANSGYTVLNLITDLTQTVSFQVRAVEAP